MANWDKMTESKFRAVKLLLKGGASVKEAAEYMQMSTATVYIINTAENFEEYTAIRVARDSKRAAAIKAKKDEQKPAPETASEPVKQVMNPTVIKVEATHYMMTELQKTNELLTAISAKLAFIVDELCGVKPNAKQDN
jgi:transposase-like protein